MRTYICIPEHSCVVCEEGSTPRELRPRLDLRNHSPDGFSWGYDGSGPAQLALAILADHFEGVEGIKMNLHSARSESDEHALKHYLKFRREVVAIMPKDEPFTITGVIVQRWVDIAERRADFEARR